MIYYVSTLGSDKNEGSREAPFRTISYAAKIAVAGDTVRVFGGEYREWVSPENSGSATRPIIYEAVEGERPIIKGSEKVTDWERVDGNVYKTVIPDSLFGDFNPFTTELFGDWLTRPLERKIHLGDVYMNGISFFEAKDEEQLFKGERREYGVCHNPWSNAVPEPIVCPDNTVYMWLARSVEGGTELLCSFGGVDPNGQTVEINVRPACFFPKKTNINYITVRGFEMAHAATQWAPPTAEQIGMVGPHWSYGWVIENNIIHDSKCSGISLGKEISTGHNYHNRFMRKSGYQNQQEAVFLGLRAGWRKGNIGSHTVRNNRIYDCGQTGIVGHMGCAFSTIEHNHIYNINGKKEFWGHEVGGIKLHAAVDVVISNNNIHTCTLGLWLDWQAQGARVTRNLFHNNTRDFFIEVTHGPATIDNNIFLSPVSFQNAAQGTAYVHNLIAGPVFAYKTLDRSTPYHYPHSTDVAGFAFSYGGDDRYYNNIILGKSCLTFGRAVHLGTAMDEYTVESEYWEKIRECGVLADHTKYFKVNQPVWFESNAYAGDAAPFRKEVNPICAEGADASIVCEDGKWVLTVTVPESLAEAVVRYITADILGAPRITEAPFEAPDGTPVDLSLDLVGEYRDGAVVPGPLASLTVGVSRITVWEE